MCESTSRTIIEGLLLDEHGEVVADLIGLLEECMPHLSAAMGHYYDHPALYAQEQQRLANLQERLWHVLEPAHMQVGEWVKEGEE